MIRNVEVLREAAKAAKQQEAVWDAKARALPKDNDISNAVAREFLMAADAYCVLATRLNEIAEKVENIQGAENAV